MGAGVTDCAGYLGGISSENIVADGDRSGLAAGGNGVSDNEACAVGDLSPFGVMLMTGLALGVDACFPPHATRNKLINNSIKMTFGWVDGKRCMFFLG